MSSLLLLFQTSATLLLLTIRHSSLRHGNVLKWMFVKHLTWSLALSAKYTERGGGVQSVMNQFTHTHTHTHMHTQAHAHRAITVVIHFDFLQCVNVYILIMNGCFCLHAFVWWVLLIYFVLSIHLHTHVHACTHTHSRTDVCERERGRENNREREREGKRAQIMTRVSFTW